MRISGSDPSKERRGKAKTRTMGRPSLRKARSCEKPGDGDNGAGRSIAYGWTRGQWGDRGQATSPPPHISHGLPQCPYLHTLYSVFHQKK